MRGDPGDPERARDPASAASGSGTRRTADASVLGGERPVRWRGEADVDTVAGGVTPATRRRDSADRLDAGHVRERWGGDHVALITQRDVDRIQARDFDVDQQLAVAGSGRGRRRSRIRVAARTRAAPPLVPVVQSLSPREPMRIRWSMARAVRMDGWRAGRRRGPGSRAGTRRRSRPRTRARAATPNTPGGTGSAEHDGAGQRSATRCVNSVARPATVSAPLRWYPSWSRDVPSVYPITSVTTNAKRAPPWVTSFVEMSPIENSNLAGDALGDAERAGSAADRERDDRERRRAAEPRQDRARSTPARRSRCPARVTPRAPAARESTATPRAAGGRRAAGRRPSPTRTRAPRSPRRRCSARARAARPRARRRRARTLPTPSRSRAASRGRSSSSCSEWRGRRIDSAGSAAAASCSRRYARFASVVDPAASGIAIAVPTFTCRYRSVGAGRHLERQLH